MTPSASGRDEAAEQVNAVMRGSRVLLAIVTRSIAEVGDVVTMPQLRVLVMIAAHGPQHLGAVAQTLGVHPSNATRTCERLVVAGLLHRTDDPADRRFLRLELTGQGLALVERVMTHRRTAVEQVMERMPAAGRRELAAALGAFAEAAGEVGDADEPYLLGLGS